MRYSLLALALVSVLSGTSYADNHTATSQTEAIKAAEGLGETPKGSAEEKITEAKTEEKTEVKPEEKTEVKPEEKTEVKKGTDSCDKDAKKHCDKGAKKHCAKTKRDHHQACRKTDTNPAHAEPHNKLRNAGKEAHEAEKVSDLNVEEHNEKE